MPAYLTISIGPRPQEARPVFSSDDQTLIDVVLREIVARIDDQSTAKVVPLSASTREGGDRQPRDGRR